jgi:hypothetical protein
MVGNRLVSGLSRDITLVEHDGAAFFAFTDLGPEALPLLEGRPMTRAKRLDGRVGPQGQYIDPLVGLSGEGIDRTSRQGAAVVPRHFHRTGAGLYGGDDPVGDQLVDILFWPIGLTV